MDELDRIIEALNKQKGELMACQSLVLSMFRALPIDLQARAWHDLLREREVAKTTFLNAAIPDAVIAGYDAAMSALDALRP